MEEAYGVGVANRYALFLDEDGDGVDAAAAALQRGAAAAAGLKGPAKGPAGAKAPLNDSKSNPAANKDQGKSLTRPLHPLLPPKSFSFRFRHRSLFPVVLSTFQPSFLPLFFSHPFSIPPSLSRDYCLSFSAVYFAVSSLF